MSIENNMITISATIEAPVEKVWDCWTLPQHITNWTFASDDWHSPKATNDLKVDGKFFTRMEAKDGSFGFDFEGTYTHVEMHRFIQYVLADSRVVKISFAKEGTDTIVTESFDPENENSRELQQQGWQAILNNFKKYVET
jgi:uncharacterized protein YndB with AHSA1/START domain